MKKIEKKIIVMLLVLVMVCGLAPNLQLVAKAEEKVPIVVIPGIMGSKLYSDEACTDMVWGDAMVVLLASSKKTGQKLDISNNLYAKGLTLASEGEYGTTETYEELLTVLEDKYSDRDVYLFSYDWRQSNVDSAKELKEELAAKGIEKADFLCHSMGGLVMSQYIVAEGTGAIKHVVTLGSPLIGTAKLLQAVLTRNILTGSVAIGNDMLYESGLTSQVKAGLLGVGELSPTKAYFSQLENGVVEGVTSGSGVQARAIYTYDDVLQRVFGDRYDQIISAHETATAGIDKMLSMDNAYFAIGYNQKTMSGATLLINVDKPADSIDSVVFYDCAYETMGDGTVAFDSANMMQKTNPANAAYFKLTHHQLAGSDASGSEWEKEKAWLFSIINDEEIDKSVADMTPDSKPFTVIRVNAPMDAEVSLNGEVLSSGDYSDNTDFGVMNLMGVDDEIKMFCVDTGDGYKVSLDATANGVLEYAVRYYDANGDLYDERMVTDVAVTNGMKITTTVDESENTVLEIDEGGNGTVDNTVVINGGGSADEPDKEEHTHTFEKPEFVWADDCKSATATFICKDDDISQEMEATVTKETVAPTTSATGKVTYTAKVEFEGEVYTDTKKVTIPKKLIITSISNQNGSVKIMWTKSDKAAGYKVYRKAGSEEAYYRLKTIEGNKTTSYTDKTEKSIVNGKKSQYYVVPYYDDAKIVAYKSPVKTNYYLKKQTISSVKTTGSKKLKVSWKKNDKANGYQVRYSTTSSFDSYKTLKIMSKSTVTKIIKDLKKNKKYYVKVRTYKIVDDKIYYSAWSSVKSKKTK